MVAKIKDPYIEFLQAAIDKETQIVGALFTRNKAKIVGIELDENMRVIKYDRSGYEAVTSFVELMERVGGVRTKKLIIDAMRPLMEKYPEIKLDL